MIDEPRRIEILRRYAIADTPPEEVFNRIADMARMHFRMPIATVSFIDDHYQWFKAARGLSVRQAARNVAFCDHTIRSDDILVVKDLAADPRFRDNPFVTHDPWLRFYAGAPLLSPDGFRLGTVAIMDRVPHPDLSADEREFLQALAATVVHELEMRLAASTMLAEMEDRRRIEAELRLVSERFRFALDHSPVVLFTQDRDLVYTWVANAPAFLPAKSMVGHSVYDLLPAAEAERLAALSRSVIETGEGLRREVTLDLAGSSRTLDLSLEPLRGADGAIIGMSGAAVDITSEKARKEALRRAYAEAQHANEAKAKFLAAASHDFRQPFQAMRLFTHLLDQSLTEPPHRRLITRLKEAMDAGENLLNGLLDISILEAGLLKPKVECFPLRPWLSKLTADFEAQAIQKGLSFRLVAPPVSLHSDPVLLGRIVGQLLSNAVKHTETGKILIGVRRAGRGYRIEVWDSGPGVPADQLEAIFEDFHQLGNPERDRSRGLGLGLGIARRIARLLGHRVAVRSWPGRGSVFSVTAAGA